MQRIADLYTSSIIYHNKPEFSYTVKYRGLYFICLHNSGNQLRDRWSFAHEIGHIALNHFACLESEVMFSLESQQHTREGITMQSDCSRLTDEQRFILEQEADLFAEELLLPRILLQPDLINSKSPEQISELFMVSTEATRLLMAKLRNSALQ